MKVIPQREEKIVHDKHQSQYISHHHLMSIMRLDGCKSAAPTRTQLTLDLWYNIQIRRCRNLQMGSHSVSYNNPNKPPIPNNTEKHRQSQLRLENYVGYNESAQCWINPPAPLNEDEAFMLVGSNANGIKPHQDLVEFIPIAERLKSLQVGIVLLNQTHLEWHRWAHHKNTHKFMHNSFDGSRIESSTKKTNFKAHTNQGGTFSAVRWTYMAYDLKEESYLTVITAYRVCNQIDPGPKNGVYATAHNTICG